MKRIFKSFIAFALLILVVTGCGERKEQVSASHSGERDQHVTAFTNVNLVPMTDEKIIKNQTVLVKKTRILEIGPSNEVSIPENAIVIDGAGAYLMPGLADMHMHTSPDWVSDYPVSPLNLYLANGVTTIRCFGPRGGSGDYILRWRDEIKQGKRIGPAIYTCGPILYGPVKDPRGVVRAQKDQGFDFIKLYSFVSKDEFHEAIATAQQLGMYTAGHIPFAVGLAGVLSEGMDEIAHIEELDFEFLDFDRTKKLGRMKWFRYLIELAVQQWGESFGLDVETLEKRYEAVISDVIGKLQSAHVPVCTTLVVGQGIVQKLFEPEAFLARPENKYLPPWYLDAFRQGKEKHQVMFKGNEEFAPFKYSMELVLLRKLRQAGVPLLLSTDAGTGSMGIVPGFSLHDELRILTENGFTPYEAIAAGTINASKVVKTMIGVDDFGTIEKGKRADLILVNENPLEDVANIQDLRGVMAAGRWYEKAALQKMITPGIPIIGAIKNAHEPDKSLKTTIEVVIGKGFTGNLPDDIDTITVTGPKGDLPIGKDDFTYIPQVRDFFIRLPGSPEIGTYTFKVTSGTMSGSATDIQSVVRTIPLSDSSTFSPAIGATLRSNTPTFSWGAAKVVIPIYYRFEIYKQHGGRVYSTRYGKDMLSHTVPDGVLKPGNAYRWRVRVADGDSWVKVQNLSYSGWQSVTMAKSFEYVYRIPERTNDGWDVASLKEVGVDDAPLNSLIRAIINRQLMDIHSVLLVKDGKLVLEEYFYGYSREKKHLIASDTKSITSILVGIAIDKQMIPDVNKKVYTFFPEYTGTRWIDQKYDITIKHALTMTAGLDWDEITNPHPHPKNPNTGMYKTDHPIKYILDKRKIAPSGERWNYNSGLTVLLGGIIKNASGLFADKFAEKYLFGPLGITNYDWYKHADGTVFTNGDLLLRPRDMAKIGYMMLRKGEWKGKQIVSREWVNESTKVHVARGVALGRKYGYQWHRGDAVVNNKVIETYFASGTGGQYIFVFPTLDLVVVFTSKIFDNSFGHQRQQAILINYILPAMLPPAPPRKPIELDSTLLDKYVGDYVYQLGKVRKVKLTIYSEGVKMYCKTSGMKFELFPETESHFFGTIKGVGNIKGSFIEDEKGIVKNLVVDFGISKVEFEKIK